jgi:hypothetical protein
VDRRFLSVAWRFSLRGSLMHVEAFPRMGEVHRMPATQFDRDSMAQWYAEQHLETDPGIVSVHYLPENAGEREIRLIEVNKLIGDRTDDAFEPIDFGVDAGTESEHKLFVLDVTPEQWERITNRALQLPKGWSLDGAVPYE